MYETALKELDGLELGCQKPIAMMDGYNFNGAKMYKDKRDCWGASNQRSGI